VILVLDTTFLALHYDDEGTDIGEIDARRTSELRL
jgi:hypothetical protein